MKNKKGEIVDFFPILFRYTCELCRENKTRERMWKTKKKINLGSADDHKYLCHKCAPTEVSAKKLFTDQDEFKLRAKRLARGLPIW